MSICVIREREVKTFKIFPLTLYRNCRFKEIEVGGRVSLKTIEKICTFFNDKCFSNKGFQTQIQ